MNNILVVVVRFGGRGQWPCAHRSTTRQRHPLCNYQRHAACRRKQEETASTVDSTCHRAWLMVLRVCTDRQHGGGDDATGPARVESALTPTHTLRTLDAAARGERQATRAAAAAAGPPTHGIIVSVLNEIHHQQNSIQINKILHEHGIKHKSKENIECRERCV